MPGSTEEKPQDKEQDESDIPVDQLQVLTPDQLTSLNQAKVKIRIANEQYLRDQPDVSSSMRALVRGLIRDRPNNPKAYAYRFFSRNRETIRKDLDAKD